MFRVDRLQNRISRLTQKRFGELALRERAHLQEWLVHQPDALGEELLIIQKEFDGFDETKERLDLLALDKGGNLVVIENKLDDTGRDVTWQALKYTAYVSGLTKKQIVEIYQAYLDRYCGGGIAMERICEFMDVEEIDEAVLNPGNGQRMIFIAANFRREVTATVLWLLSRGIRAQCFRVAPYSFGEELFIDLQQIIPTPEASDYMIGISSKEVEETDDQGRQARRKHLTMQFWTRVLEKFREDGITRFANISPNRDHWLNAGSGVRGCPLTITFGRSGVRVELNLARSERDENKWLFDKLTESKAQIEATFGSELSWHRLDGKKQSRIAYGKSFDSYDQENWPDMINWLSLNIRQLEDAFLSPLSSLAKTIPSALDDESE